MKKTIVFLVSCIQKFLLGLNIGKNTIIKFPFKLWNKSELKIGENTFIAENSFFAITKLKNNSEIVSIGSNVCIGSNFFIAAIDKIIIEDNVLISDRVFLSDHCHGFEDINVPIISQPLKEKGKVILRNGCFIGINSVIMPGVSIGKNSVVGASSVVTKSVPDYTVVAGNPAKIIRKIK